MNWKEAQWSQEIGRVRCSRAEFNMDLVHINMVHKQILRGMDRDVLFEIPDQ